MNDVGYIRIDAPRPTRDQWSHIEAQARADEVYRDLGMGAPPTIPGEDLDSYRRRLLRPLTDHLADFERQQQAAQRYLPKPIKDGAVWGKYLSGMTGTSGLSNVEHDVFAGVKALADCNDYHPPGQLRAKKVRDQSGREATEFFGDPLTWMNQFMGPAQAVTRIEVPATRDLMAAPRRW
jgi:hypothetical protein